MNLVLFLQSVGQKAKVKGFVVHLETLPDDYIMITRFVITHCVLDASPMGLPVKLTQIHEAYPKTKTADNKYQQLCDSNRYK